MSQHHVLDADGLNDWQLPPEDELVIETPDVPCRVIRMQYQQTHDRR